MTGLVDRQVENFRTRQRALSGKTIVKEKPRPEHRGWTLFGMNRQNKLHRAYQMRRGAQSDVPLRQSGSHPPRVAALESDEVSVHQMWSRHGRAAAKVTLFEQSNPQTAAGSVTRDRHAVETASDNRDIDISHAVMISDDVHRESSLTN